MTKSMASCLELAKKYLKALEDGAVGDELAAFFDPEVIQEEFPNRLVPNGARQDLAGLLEGAERGQGLLLAQRFDLVFLNFRNGKIVSQRNYDCFEPW